MVPLAPLRETDHRVGCGGGGGGLSNLIGSFFGGPNYSVIESTVIRASKRWRGGHCRLNFALLEMLSDGPAAANNEGPRASPVKGD